MSKKFRRFWKKNKTSITVATVVGGTGIVTTVLGYLTGVRNGAIIASNETVKRICAGAAENGIIRLGDSTDTPVYVMNESTKRAIDKIIAEETKEDEKTE